MSHPLPLPAFLDRIIGARSDDPDLARRELALNVVAAGLLLLAVLWIPAHLLTAVLTAELPTGAGVSSALETYASAGTVLAVCLLIYGLSRHGSVRLAGFLLITGLLGFTTWLIWRWGIEVPDAMLYFLAVALAGLLAGRRASWLTATVALLLYGGVGLLQQVSIHPIPLKRSLLPTVVAFGLVLYIAAALNWIAERLLNNALHEARQHAAELRAAREEQAHILADLRAQATHQSQLLNAVEELSAPLIAVHDQIIVLPLVGHLDEDRAGLVRQALLQGVVRHRAKFAIIDLTGLSLVNREIVHHLESMGQAGRLLGAEVVFVGLHAQAAAEMIQAGADLRNLRAQRDLQSGIQWALAEMGQRIVTF